MRAVHSIPVLLVERLEPFRSFYAALLGCHQADVMSVEGTDSRMVVLQSPLGVVVCAERFDGLGAPPPTRDAMIRMLVPDPAAIRSVLAKRTTIGPGELRSGPGGPWFDVVDPGGNIVRFVQPDVG